MEYGSVIRDPYTKQEITKLESIQRSGASFITKDYKSREEGCMTKMLNELNLPTLQSRRQKQRLLFFYKVVEAAGNSNAAGPICKLPETKTSNQSRKN